MFHWLSFFFALLSARFSGWWDGRHGLPDQATAPYVQEVAVRGGTRIRNILRRFQARDGALFQRWVMAESGRRALLRQKLALAEQQPVAETEFQTAVSRDADELKAVNPPGSWYLPFPYYLTALVIVSAADLAIMVWAFSMQLSPLFAWPLSIMLVMALIVFGHVSGDYARRNPVWRRRVLGGMLVIVMAMIGGVSYFREIAVQIDAAQSEQLQGESLVVGASSHAEAQPQSSQPHMPNWLGLWVFTVATVVGYLLPTVLAMYVQERPHVREWKLAKRRKAGVGRQLQTADRRLKRAQRAADSARVRRLTHWTKSRNEVDLVQTLTHAEMAAYRTTNTRWRKDLTVPASLLTLPEVPGSELLKPLEWVFPFGDALGLTENPGWVGAEADNAAARAAADD